ncbi:Endoglucanase 3 [Hordeum vulgare]|nr:Endoglucanase 3 [Hordeum vulgare]
MLAGSSRTWLNSLPAGSVNSWVDFEEAFVRNFTGTYKRPGRHRELAMRVERPDNPLRDYVTRWPELRNSSEGVHEVQAIEYFIDGCRDGTLLKHKLMCSEPTSLAVLMAKADKSSMADSARRVKVSASDKIVPTLTTPKPAGDNRGGQNDNKRKADQLDSRSNNKLVANMEGDASATQAGSQRRWTGKNDRQPKLTFEQMLDAPYKLHTGAKPATHILR